MQFVRIYLSEDISLAREWSKRDDKGLARFVIAQESARWLTVPENRTDLMQAENGRLKLIQVIYETLLNKNIKYSPESYKPSEETQLIRTPEEILDSPREATCLDLSILFSSLCIANELLPIMILIEGHALMMVSLQHGLRDWNALFRKERNLFQTDVVEDVSKIRALIDEGKYLAIECTGFAQSKSLSPNFPEGINRNNDGFLSFERATEAGYEQLGAGSRKFSFAIDIAYAQYAWRMDAAPSKIDQNKLLNPFNLLKPFTTAEANTFFGRKVEIENIVETVENHNVTLVHGKADIGKTSLLSAGVTRELFKKGWNVLQIREYSVLVNDPKIEELSKQNEEKTVFILDQFELLFEPSIDENERNNFIEKLIKLQKSLKIKIIIATREYEKTKAILNELLQDEIADIGIGLLTGANARAAIIKPLENNGFKNVNSEYIGSLLLPELDKLSGELEEFNENEGIYPPLLQIVCYRLIETASEFCNSVIGETLFNEHYNSVEYIVGNYTNEQLKKLFPEKTDTDQAIQILVASLSSDIAYGVSSDKLLISDLKETVNVEEILKKLTEANFLVKRTIGNENQYALASPVMVKMIRIIAYAELKYQELARIELRSAWKTWVVNKMLNEMLASPEEVKFLISHNKTLKPDPIDFLFLLRSSVEHKIPPGSLLKTFVEDKQLRDFIGKLEQGTLSPIGTRLNYTSSLLNVPIEQSETLQKLKLKSIAKIAVSNNSPQARQTSALLLTILSDEAPEKRLSVAFGKIMFETLHHKITGLKKDFLLAELSGVIWEAYTEIDKQYKDIGLDRNARFIRYCWLFTRRFKRNASFIFKTTFYSALLFGFSLGIIRGVPPAITEITNRAVKNFAPPALATWGTYSFLGIGSGTILAAFFTFGLVCAGCFFVKSQSTSLNEIYKPSKMTWKECTIAALSGAAFFSLGQIILAYLFKSVFDENNIILKIVAPTGFVIGLGAASGYLVFLKLDSILGKTCRILGAYISAMVFGLTQYILIKFTSFGINQVWTKQRYIVEFSLPYNFWTSFQEAVPDWAVYFSSLDAFLVGLALFVSVAVSFKLSDKYLKE